MNYLRNKLIFNCLTSTGLLLVLLGAAHGAKQALSIELEEGGSIRAWRKDIQVRIPTPFQMGKVGDVTRIHIGSMCIDIDSSNPFNDLVPVLAPKPGIRSVALVPLSPDEKCENKISQFNEIPLSSLSLQEKINLHRKVYSSLQKYKGQGSTLAEKYLPTRQNLLGVALGNQRQSITFLFSFIITPLKFYVEHN